MRRDPRTLTLALTAAAALGLSACGGSTAQTAPPPSAAPAAPSSPDASPDPATGASPDAAPATEGAYIDHATYQADPADYADGDVVLFFHATWCSSCQATEASLTGDGVPAGLTVVKVDYDNETDLKKKHGITQQHTFVAVNPAGDQLAKWSGSVTGEEIKAKANA